jgi:hypothetical protein
LIEVPPQEVVEDPDCDYGTALAIYWMGAPGYDQQFAKIGDVGSWRRPTFRFLRTLEKRLLARDFATSDILFNPRFDRTTVSKTGHDWTAEYDDVKVVRPIPDALKEPSKPDPKWEKRGRVANKNTANRLT